MARIGRLRHRWELLRRQPGLDSRGQAKGQWRVVGKLYAGVRPLSMRENEQANRQYAVATHAMDVRYRADVIPQPGDRFSRASRTLELGSVVNVEERDRWLTILVSEIV